MFYCSLKVVLLGVVSFLGTIVKITYISQLLFALFSCLSIYLENLNAASPSLLKVEHN